MGQIRKNHSADFKAKVRFSDIREDATLAEFSSRFGIHASLIQRWKKEGLAGMKDIFSGKQAIQEKKPSHWHPRSPYQNWPIDGRERFLENASKRLGLFGGKK